MYVVKKADAMCTSMVRCTVCGLIALPDVCTQSWFISLLIADVSSEQSYSLHFRNDYVHRFLKEDCGIEFEDGDNVAKQLLSVKVPLKLIFFIVARNVKFLQMGDVI